MGELPEAVLQAIQGLGMKALEIPTHPRSGMSVDALDLASQKRGGVRAVLLVPTFSNPLGATIPDDQRRRLVELCAEREIPIIENDVLGEVSFEDSRPKPLKFWGTTRTDAFSVRLVTITSGDCVSTSKKYDDSPSKFATSVTVSLT